MKKIALTVLSVLIIGGLSAQSSEEGKVIYQEVQKLDIQLEGEAAQFAHALPKERKSTKELLFTASESMYRNNKDAENAEDVSMEQGNMNVQIKMMEPDNQFYVDITKQKTVEKREFMSRNFLIENKVEALGWKMTGEQKTILDYPCQQAVKTNEEGEETIAWFSPAIAVSSGPSSFVGLPGLVLEVSMSNGDHLITAQKIVFSSVSKNDLVKPKKGKKVTKEEFDKIVEEKMKEMGGEGGEGGTFIMRIER
jgi:GLPGLI family protein